MITVAELRARLARYPDDMPVVVDGYEGGYDDPIVAVVDLVPGPAAPEAKPIPYEGRHIAPRRPRPDSLEAVVVGRLWRDAALDEAAATLAAAEWAAEWADRAAAAAALDAAQAAQAAARRAADAVEDDAIHQRAMALAEAWASAAPGDRVQAAMVAYKAHGGGE